VKHQRRPVIVLAILAFITAFSPAIAQQSQTEIEDITADVSQVRQLPVEQEIELTVITRDELREDYRGYVEEEYPEDEQNADMRELLAFGLIDEPMDFGELYSDLYGEQVAGYYDSETGRMVVVRDTDAGGTFTAMEQVTYAHEIVHALQDQNFDLDGDQLGREDVSDDRAYAITALIEGDASFSEVRYVIERPELLDAYLEEAESAEFDTSVLDTVPPIIRETLIFPYNEGYTFVEAIYNEGGWDAVNAAFSNPPSSTEQILHPEKYLAGEQPVDVPVNDYSGALGDDWTVWDTNTFGEFQIRVILQQTSMSDQQADVAASGWGGDTYVVAGTEEQDAIHWVSTWDTEEDANEFVRAWALREAERWGVDPVFAGADVIEFQADDAFVRITLNGTTVEYLMAPDEATVAAILAAPPATPAATPMASPVASPAA
jgi:Asp-tRNA(Asn)/Glu-tRNA(Gln) amidotransferase C subunit